MGVMGLMVLVVGCAGVHPDQARQDYAVTAAEEAGYAPVRMGTGAGARTAWVAGDGRARLDGPGGTVIFSDEWRLK